MLMENRWDLFNGFVMLKIIERRIREENIFFNKSSLELIFKVMNFSRHSNEIDSKLIEFRKIKKIDGFEGDDHEICQSQFV